MSQRGYPTMALVQPQIDLSDEKGEVSLFLNAPGMEEIEIKLSQGTRPTKTVKLVVRTHLINMALPKC